jgi:hypothetical protein
MFYLKTDEEKVYFADNHVLQMISNLSTMYDQTGRAYFDLEYSNSMCRQSSIPTSILMELLDSTGGLYEYTHKSFSRITSAIRLDSVTRIK